MIRRGLVSDKLHAGYIRFVPKARTWRRDGAYITFTSHGFVAARTPEELLARHNYEVAEIAAALRGRSFKRSLEVGCGFGRLSPSFARSSAHHVAIDINPEALHSAQRFYPGMDYKIASVTDLPFESQTFDMISTWTVLQHVPPAYIEKALSEIVRVATDGALLLFCEETATTDVPLADEWHTHTWHRRPHFYADHVAPFQLKQHRAVSGLVQVGLATPGDVMIFSQETF